MIKKFLFLLLVLAFAYSFILPAAIENKQAELNAAGAADTSVLNFLHPDPDQND